MNFSKVGRKKEKMMGTLNNAVKILGKRPSILVLTIVMSAIVCFFEFLFMTLVYSFSMFKSGGSVFDDYINIIQFFIGTIAVPTTAVKIIIALVVLVLAASLVLAFLFSGYMNILNNAVLERNKKTGSEFLQGLKTHFIKLFSVNLWTVCSTILFVIYLIIASIPAVIVLDNAINGSLNIVAGIFLVLLTAVVLFFSFAFFRQYICFWYPSTFTYEKNHFKMAKKISDFNFWYLLSRFIIFDIVFILFEVLYIFANFSLANNQVVGGVANTILFIVNLVFKTVFIALFVSFVFSSFKQCDEKFPGC
jgi:hypothetical protein